jgi:hypothetical protein
MRPVPPIAFKTTVGAFGVLAALPVESLVATSKVVYARQHLWRFEGGRSPAHLK